VRGASAALLAWGTLLLVLGLGLAAWSEVVPSLLLIGGSTPFFALAAWHRARPRRHEARLVPSVSMPVVVVAIGLATAAIGLTAGLWLGLVGAEIFLFGAVWLGREIWEERRWGR
jgi:hypothetical protein